MRLSTEDFTKLINSQKNAVQLKSGANLNELGLVRFSSGIYTLDRAMGGGYPFGRCVLLCGNTSCGKSTLAYKACGAIASYDQRTRLHRSAVPDDQFSPCQTLLVDAETNYTPEWGNKHLDPDNLHIVTSAYMEEVGDLIGSAIFHNSFGLIIIDSIAALITMTERNRSLEDNSMAETARLLSRAFRRWTREITSVQERGEIAPCILLINQYRDNVGVMYGDKMALPGGKAQLYYPSIRISMNASKYEGQDKNDKITPYKSVSISGYCKKNKTFTPQRPFEFEMAIVESEDVQLGEVDNLTGMFKDGMEYGIIARESVGVSFNGTQYTSQKELKAALACELDLQEHLRVKLMEVL